MSRLRLVMRGRGSGEPVERMRSLATDIFLTTLSLAVVAIGVLYVAFPPGPTMALDVQTAAIEGDRAVVYGEVVDTDGRPVRGASVVVSRIDGTVPVRVLSMTAASDGTFRGEVASPGSAEYRVVVSADVGGRIARDTASLRLASGRSYGITAELHERDYFVFLPISSY